MKKMACNERNARRASRRLLVCPLHDCVMLPTGNGGYPGRASAFYFIRQCPVCVHVAKVAVRLAQGTRAHQEVEHECR
jgi:hypothetical protein